MRTSFYIWYIQKLERIHMNMKLITKAALCTLLVTPYIQANYKPKQHNNVVRTKMLKVFDEFLSNRNPEKKVKDYATEMETICNEGDNNFKQSHNKFFQNLKSLNSSNFYKIKPLSSTLAICSKIATSEKRL